MLTSIIERAHAISAPDVTSGITINETTGTIPELVTTVISWILYIAFILAFIYLVISGITFITAGGNAEQAKKGQQGLIYAIIGIVVVTMAYVILTAANNLGTTSAP